MRGADELFSKLSKGKAKRKKLELILSSYYSVFPEYKNQSNYAEHLLNILNFLKDNNKIELPSIKGKSWRPGKPMLPDWIKVIRVHINKNTIPNSYAWHPKLAPFVDSLRINQRESAFKISEYLKHHSKNGVFKFTIPRRERSLKIFGDEKKLDSLSNSGELFGGCLTLDDLGCYDVSWPMPFESPSKPCPNKPFLILENHHTFESFKRWNESSRQYSGIGYGAGEAFSTLGSDRIDDIILPLKTSEILYFGDLDPKGISIPARVNKARIAKDMPPIHPAINLYEYLIADGIKRPFDKGKQRKYISGWLPTYLEKRVNLLFSDSKWLPQEALGYEELINNFNTLAP